MCGFLMFTAVTYNKIGLFYGFMYVYMYVCFMYVFMYVGTKRLKTAFEWLAKTPFYLVRMRWNGLVRKAFLSIRLHGTLTLI